MFGLFAKRPDHSGLAARHARDWRNAIDGGTLPDGPNINGMGEAPPAIYGASYSAFAEDLFRQAWGIGGYSRQNAFSDALAGFLIKACGGAPRALTFLRTVQGNLERRQ